MAPGTRIIMALQCALISFFAQHVLDKGRLFSFLFYPITFQGLWDITDDFPTIPFHLVLF